MDSLARLLEGEGECAAVCFVDNEILITSNAVSQVSRGIPSNQQLRFMQVVLLYLSNENPAHHEIINLLVVICQKKINSLQKGNLFFYISQKSLISIVDNLFKNDGGTYREWMMEDLNFFVQFLEDDDKTTWEHKDSKYYLELTEEEKISHKQELIKIRTKLTAIQLTFAIAWRFVRDFQKAHQFFNDEKIDDCKILAVGVKNEHAELRMLGYLLEKQKLFAFAQKPEGEEEDQGANKYLYIGISKLCCAHCACLISALSKSLQIIRKKYLIAVQYEDENRDEQVIKANEFDGLAIELIQHEEEREEAEKSFEVPGSHGLFFKKSKNKNEVVLPVPPAYAQNKPYLNEKSIAWSLKKYSDLSEQTYEAKRAWMKLSTSVISGEREIENFYVTLEDTYNRELEELKIALENLKAAIEENKAKRQVNKKLVLTEEVQEFLDSCQRPPVSMTRSPSISPLTQSPRSPQSSPSSTPNIPPLDLLETSDERKEESSQQNTLRP